MKGFTALLFVSLMFFTEIIGAFGFLISTSGTTLEIGVIFNGIFLNLTQNCYLF